MVINGVIAEYNPFHNGHKYQLNDAANATGADYTIAVMSGNFVQRGAPAIINKFLRAEMALQNGADLVLEIPAYYAASSAEYFAHGAVTLLDKLSVTDHLCFGSELGTLPLLQELASILAEEPAGFAENLRRNLRSGMSFPAARIQALTEYTGQNIQDLLGSPNNILAIEYLKTLLRRDSTIHPYTTKRMGADYHSIDLNSQYSSASAIRRQLLSVGTIDSHMPESALEILQSQEKASDKTSGLLSADDFSAVLHYKLLSEMHQGFTDYLDVTEELSDRICNHIYEFTSFESFVSLLKTKEMTYTRISRCLLHILLGMTRKSMEKYLSGGSVYYGRILGFRREAAPLMHALKQNSSIPLITKLADAESVISDFYAEKDTERLIALDMLSEELAINRLYESAVSLKTGRPMLNEYRTPVVIL